MADLLLGNIDEHVTDAEINEFLERYGFPPFDAIQRIEGAGRPAALLTVHSASEEGLRKLQGRILNLFWREHTISAQVMPPAREE